MGIRVSPEGDSFLTLPPRAGGDGLGDDYQPGPAPPGYQWVEYPPQFPGGPPQWDLVRIFAEDTGVPSASSKLSYELGLAQLAEDARSNRAREAAMARQRALDAATSALSAYLRGSELADARRLSALQESRQLLPFLVSPGQEFFSGLEPSGALAQVAANYGLPFSPVELQHKELRPGELAAPPTGGQIGEGILAQIGNVQGQGF